MFGTVIDYLGYRVEFVVLDDNKQPQYYTLKEGEEVVEEDWQIANSMNKPRWDKETRKWIDTDPLPPQEVLVLPTKVDVLLINGYTGQLSVEIKNDVVYLCGELSSDNHISDVVGNIPSNMYPKADIKLNGITITTNGQIINTGLGIINGNYLI